MIIFFNYKSTYWCIFVTKLKNKERNKIKFMNVESLKKPVKFYKKNRLENVKKPWVCNYESRSIFFIFNLHFYQLYNKLFEKIKITRQMQKFKCDEWTQEQPSAKWNAKSFQNVSKLCPKFTTKLCPNNVTINKR